MRSSLDPGSLPGTTVCQIGEWQVEPALNELRRCSEVQRVEPKAMEYSSRSHVADPAYGDAYAALATASTYAGELSEQFPWSTPP